MFIVLLKLLPNDLGCCQSLTGYPQQQTQCRDREPNMTTVVRFYGEFGVVCLDCSLASGLPASNHQ